MRPFRPSRAFSRRSARPPGCNGCPPSQAVQFNGLRAAPVAPTFVDAAYSVSIRSVGRRTSVTVEAAKKS